jgi:hypothetical protein
VESDGKLFSITVPQGVKSGDIIAVEIEADIAQEGMTDPAALSSDAPAEWVQQAERCGEPPTDETAVEPRKPPSDTKKAMGAAVVAAVVGTLLVGPITGVVVAGAALYATTRKDRIGAAAMGVGGAAAVGYDKTKEAAEKNDVYNRVKAAGAATAKKAGEIDERYQVSKNVKAATKATVTEAVRINNKYDLTGQATRGMMSAGAAIGKLVSSKPASQPAVESTTTTSA